VAFAPFILCDRLTDPARLQDRRYIAEPKLDGQRAQVHMRQTRTVACYSCRGLDLLRHAGMAWLLEITWPVASAVLDGEVVAGDRHEGIQAVFMERQRPDGDMALMVFDLVELDSQRVLPEPWRDRRNRLEDLFDSVSLPRVGLCT
jgi:ATP-dependent DNA ligase